MGDYLNRPDIRDRLGATSPGNYTGCSLDVGMRFAFSGDLLHNSRVYVEELLERGVRVLQYVGRYDLACSWVRFYSLHTANCSNENPVAGQQ